MVANDPLKSFDAFLDSVTQMHDAITKFGIGVDNPHVSEQPQFDADFATINELDEFKISEGSDNSSGIDSDSDDLSVGADDESHGASEVLSWLEEMCNSINMGGMSSSDLYSTILGIITSASSDDELQSSLPEVIGYENLDFIIELISKRASIIAAQVCAPQMINVDTNNIVEAA